jgi:hypothetical protein
LVVVPMTVAPLSFASCAQAIAMPPLAPVMTTVSPGPTGAWRAQLRGVV